MDFIGKRKFRRGKVFFGWWTVLVTSITYFWCYGIWSYSFGVYYEPLINEFGWSGVQISSAASVRMIVGGLGGYIIGRLVDKYGSKAISFTGILCAGIGFFLLYSITSPLHWSLIWGLIISLGFSMALMMSLDAGIAKWFVRKRGTAVGAAKFFMGLGGMALPVIMTFLLNAYGWRMAFVIAGLIVLTILPLVWFGVKSHRPEYYGLMPDGETVESVEDTALIVKAGQEYAAKVGEWEFTLRQAMRTKGFWILTFVNVLSAPVFPVFSFHMIPHLINLGIDPLSAATIIGFAFLIGAPLRFIGGWLSDRISIHMLKYVWMTAYGFEALGLFVAINASTVVSVYLSTILWGIGYGLMVPMRVPIIGRYFGRKAFATITGAIQTIALPASVIAPIYIGWVNDVTGSYINAFTQIMILLILSIVILFLFLYPPKGKPESAGTG